MASLFALVNFCMIFRAIYDIGREDEMCIRDRFKREQPETVRPLKQILKEMEFKKKLQKEKKEEQRKHSMTGSMLGRPLSALYLSITRS